MQLTLNHTVHYTYNQPTDYALQKLRLRPRSSNGQDITDWSLQVDGGRIEASYRDHYGNHTDLVSVDPGAQKVTVTASGKGETRDLAGVMGMDYGRAPLWHFAQITETASPDPRLSALAKQVAEAKDRLSGLHDLSEALLAAAEAVDEDSDSTAGQSQTLGTVASQEQHIGTAARPCLAHDFIAAARLAGIPARFVSGYVMAEDETDVADQGASHLWAEAHVEALGWVGFDVAAAVSPNDRYLRIAVGRDARDVALVNSMPQGTLDETTIVSSQVEK